jgi:pimeloyl-ACP methyl ester carboxylesterase
MAHGLTAVKEMALPDFAEVFAAAGLNVLLYDHRNFGASDGTPRQEVDPVAQYRGYRHAITYAITRPEVDPERVGIWGTSFSGGLVLTVAAIDHRVKAVVSQVPFIDGYDTAHWLVRPDMLGHLFHNLDADRANRFAGGEPATMPAVDPDPMAPSLMPDPEAWEWFSTAGARAPRWKNEVTAHSFDLISEFSPRSYVHRISPTPLLMIIARTDVCAPHEFAFQAFSSAHEPKRLLVTDGGHFGLYAGEGFAIASAAARDHFVEHLGVTDSVSPVASVRQLSHH